MGASQPNDCSLVLPLYSLHCLCVSLSALAFLFFALVVSAPLVPQTQSQPLTQFSCCCRQGVTPTTHSPRTRRDQHHHHQHHHHQHTSPPTSSLPTPSPTGGRATRGRSSATRTTATSQSDVSAALCTDAQPMLATRTRDLCNHAHTCCLRVAPMATDAPAVHPCYGWPRTSGTHPLTPFPAVRCPRFPTNPLA